MSKDIFYILGIIIVTMGFILAFSLMKSPTYQPSQYDEFAKCLASKNITMYGASWCPHCQNQKKDFGDSFHFISYVECPDNPQKCDAAGVNSYPTWILPDGKKLIGEQALDNLSKESGCPLI